MVSLARKTLWREWPRFFPAILAVCFAGVLLFIQAALVLGIFGSAAVYVTASSADIWLGYPGTQSVNLGRGISYDLEMLLRTNDQISHVEPLIWVDADWRSNSSLGGVSVYVIGMNSNEDGVIFDKVLPAKLRPLLREPGAVIVDRADLDTLGIHVGDYAWIEGQRVHVVATSVGLRALGGVNILCSLNTARRLNNSNKNNVTYWVAKVKNSQNIQSVTDQLKGNSSFGPYEVSTAKEFAHRSQFFWMLDTGAGVAVLFMVVIVILVGIVVACQSLISVVISASREYATLNALGVGMKALRSVVLEQSAWIGAIGLTLSFIISNLLLVLARSQDIPIAMTPLMTVIWASLVFGISLISGLLAMRGLLRADVNLLLR